MVRISIFRMHLEKRALPTIVIFTVLLLLTSIFAAVSNASHIAYASPAQPNTNRGCDFTAENIANENNHGNKAANPTTSETHSFSQPYGIAFDCRNGRIYVLNAGSNSVAVLDGSNNNMLIKNIPLPSTDSSYAPSTMIYDQIKNRIYLTNFGGTMVAVINPRNNTLVKTIPISHGENAMGYGLAVDQTRARLYEIRGDDVVTNIDPSTGLFVHEHRDPVLNVINLKNDTIIKSIVLPNSIQPRGVAFDSINHNIYVNSGTGKVIVIDSIHYKIIKNIDVGSTATSVVFNPKNKDIYVAGTDAHGVQTILYVIDGISKEVVKTILLPKSSWTTEMAVDQISGDIYVAARSSDGTGGLIHVINGTTNEIIKTMSVGSDAGALAFDSRTGDLYVTDSSSNVLYDAKWPSSQISMIKAVY